MKYLLLLFLLFPIVGSAASRNHHIDLNVYIIESGQKFPLYETQKMYKKFFDLMVLDDKVLGQFKDNFYDIKYIEVFVPNEIGAEQNVIVGFKNKKKKKKTYQAGGFFHFTESYYGNNKIFSYAYLRNVRENLETISMFNNKYESYEYAKILKVSY